MDRHTTIIFALFFIWGLPLGHLRNKFRKIVYQTDSWTIAIKPYFIKETKALFMNMYPNNTKYQTMRKMYGIYLLIYLALLVTYLTAKS